MNLDIGSLKDVNRLVEEIARESEILRTTARSNAQVSVQLLDTAKNLKSTIRIMEETMQALATSEERLAEGVAKSLLRVLERALQVKDRLEEFSESQHERADGGGRNSGRQISFDNIWGDK